ncbi:hypothetical protein HMPREF1987_01046 [Peptostreptococcaceae bacterium oral taxon 113 str. W5053]|nr:hypothetical protein HMPREF1987_01046 [Peptostreptococcaceae bacterium oral taxon 113 str. W5053]
MDWERTNKRERYFDHIKYARKNLSMKSSFFDFFTNGTVVVFYQIIKSKMNYSCCFL